MHSEVMQKTLARNRGPSAKARADPFRAHIPFHDMDFPLRTSHIAPLLPEFRYLHSHPEYEIAYVPHDYGSYMIQDVELPIEPGDIFIVNANEIHQPILSKPGNRGAVVTYFRASLFGDPEESAQWIEPFLHAAALGCNRLRADNELRGLIGKLHKAVDPENRSWKLVSRGLLTHILSIVARLFAERCEELGASPRIAKAHRFGAVIAHINENLGARIEAAQLYRLAGLAHSRFSEEFRVAFGVSLVRYIQTQRLKRAKRLLRSTEMSMTAIACAAGFGATSLFNKVFKKELGISPTQFRKQCE
jgi:AraC-like DNA-binding protein